MIFIFIEDLSQLISEQTPPQACGIHKLVSVLV
jgi:hypothetical protein